MRYPLFGTGQKGTSVNVSSQRRLNVFAEMPVDPDKGQLVLYGTPGLDPFLGSGSLPWRGGLSVGDNLYAVRGDTAYSINNAATETAIGTVGTSSGWVDIFDDRANVMFLDGDSGYVYNIAAATFTQIVSPDFPSGAKSGTWSDQTFIVEDGTSVAISALGDPLTWDAADRKESESNPDGIVRVTSDHGELVVFGDQSIEFWGNTGAADFPYERIGSGVAEWGIAAKRSLAKFPVRDGESSMILLAKKKGMTNVQVCVIVGYTLKPVSNPSLEAEINSYSSVADATAGTYMDRGHPFYQINFPTANKSWLYDGLTGLWSERSTGTDRHRGEIFVEFLNTTKVSDFANGNIYTLDHDTYTDNGVAIISEADTRHVFDESRSCIGSLRLDLETGVGNSDVEDPQVMLKVSKDGGHTWSSEVWRPIGKVGEYNKQVFFYRLGSAFDWVFRFRITDAVKRVFVGGWIEIEK